MGVYESSRWWEVCRNGRLEEIKLMKESLWSWAVGRNRIEGEFVEEDCFEVLPAQSLDHNQIKFQFLISKWGTFI